MQGRSWQCNCQAEHSVNTSANLCGNLPPKWIACGSLSVQWCSFLMSVVAIHTVHACVAAGVCALRTCVCSQNAYVHGAVSEYCWRVQCVIRHCLRICWWVEVVVVGGGGCCGDACHNVQRCREAVPCSTLLLQQPPRSTPAIALCTYIC